MVNVTNEFKTAISAPIRLGKAYIHIVEDNIDLTESDFLKSVKLQDYMYTTDNGFIGGVISKKCDIEIINDGTIDLIDKTFILYEGIKKSNNTYEYVSYGTFIIQKPVTTTTSIQTTFTAYDNIIKLTEIYKTNLVFPQTLYDTINDLCTTCGINFGNEEIINGDFIVDGNFFQNAQSFRVVLQALTQLTMGFVKIGRDDKLYIKNLDINGSSVCTIDKNNYFSLTKNQTYGPVNVLVLKNSQVEGENITLKDEESIALYGETEISISDNPLVYSMAKRTEAITDMFNYINGLIYTDFSIEYQGFPHLDSGDKITILDTSNNTIGITYLFNHDINYSGGFSGKIQTQALTKTQTKYQYVSPTNQALKTAEITVNKAIAEIRSEVEAAYSFNKTVTGTGTLNITDCKGESIINLTATKTVDYTDPLLYPRSSLFPGSTLYSPEIAPTDRTFPSESLYPTELNYTLINLKITGDIESELNEYQINTLYSLRRLGAVADELSINFDFDKGICVVNVIRKLEVVDGELVVLSTPTIQYISDLNIQLFKGINYITIDDINPWNLEVTYLVDNEFTEYMASTVELSSKIVQTEDSILLEVDKKVNSDEIISSINLSPEEIAIKSNKITLEGLTTINGGFSVDEEGDVSIANDTVVINKNGITLADGAEILGGDGLLSVFQYKINDGSGGSGSYQFGNAWYSAGFYDYQGYRRDYSKIVFYIPNNFTITEAYITMYHTPICITNYPGYTNLWCGSTNLRLYKNLSDINSRYISGLYLSEASEFGVSNSEISGAFGTNGFTATLPTSYPPTGTVTQKVTSTNIASQLTSGTTNILTIESTDTVSDDYNMYKKTGQISATLTVIGFTKNT